MMTCGENAGSKGGLLDAVQTDSVRWKPLQDKGFLILMGVSLAIAILQVVLNRGDTFAALEHDDLHYHELAAWLHKHGRYATNYESSFWPPGYPAFLALVYSLLGISLVAAYAVHAVFFVATIGLVYRIALYTTGSVFASRVAVILCLVSPSLRGAIPSLYTESFSAVVLSVLVWCLLLEIAEPRLHLAVLIGLLGGWLALTKPASIPSLIALAAFVALSKNDRRIRLVHGAVVVLILAAFLGAWTVRNYRVLGAFVPVATSGGFTFWLGNNPQLYRQPAQSVVIPRDLQQMLAGKSQVEANRILMRKGLRFIVEDPARAIYQFLSKFGRMWLNCLGVNPSAMPGNSNMPRIGSFGIPLSSVFPTLAFCLAIYGWFVLPCISRQNAKPLLALLVCWTIPYVAVVAVFRYIAPVVGFEMIFAAAGIQRLWDRLRSPGGR